MSADNARPRACGHAAIAMIVLGACTTTSKASADSMRIDSLHSDSARAAVTAPAMPIDTQPAGMVAAAESTKRVAKPAPKKPLPKASSGTTTTIRPKPGDIIGHDSAIHGRTIKLPVIPRPKP